MKLFPIKEYVPPALIQKHGEVFCMRFMDERILMADALLKEKLEKHYGEEISVVINDWAYKGSRIDSGYRPLNSITGNDTSLHRFGRASDKKFRIKRTGKFIDVKEVYALIMGVWHDEFFAIGIRRVEDIRDTATWIHWDTCYTGLNKIIAVRP